MAFVHRRIFYGKVGKGGDLVAHLQEGFKTFESLGATFNSRILSDYMSGRTDRIVWETEVDDFASMDAAMEKVMSDPKGQEIMETWFSKLTELIHYAEAENWTIH